MSRDVDGNGAYPDPQRGPRDGFKFTCGYGCETNLSGDDLVKLARRAARHYNEKHGDDLDRRYQRFDRKEVGGHHVHGNTYQVERRDLYLTVYDMFDRVGAVDGWLAGVESDRVCPECNCIIPATEKEHRLEDEPDNPLNDEWTCSVCIEEQEIDRKAKENQQITEWTT